MRSFLSQSGEVAFSKESEKPHSSHQSRVSGQNKTVSMTSSQWKKELLLAQLRTEGNKRQNEASMRFLEIKQRLEEVQICEKNRKNYVEAKIAEAELE